MEGRDAEHYSYPLMGEVYKRRRYLTSYGKTQKTNFDGVVVDRNAEPDSYSGIVSISDGMITLGDNGEAVYEFSVPAAGSYDLAVKLGFPLWDKNSVRLSLDGTSVLVEEPRLWWPYWRTTFWKGVWKAVSLSAGTHTLTVSVAAKGVQFYGFKVCSSFAEETSVSEASYLLSPRKFKDIHGVMVAPREGFKLTFEMLRRKADSALIWYEDFRDRPPLPESYWSILSGEWQVWQEDEFGKNRPYSQLEGYGELALNYGDFQDLHLRAQLIFPQSFTGRAGVYLGDLFCCLNYEAQAVELYQGDVLLGSYATSFEKTADAKIRDAPNLYTIEMRKRGTNVRVYSGASSSLRFQKTVANTSGFAGISSDSKVHCQLFRVGDSFTYEPYECFDVVLPDGSRTSFGRIPRTGVSWDDEFQVFTVTSDIEEHETRTESISLDYEFFHSSLLPLVCGNDYQVKVIPRDINVWISRLFLGDSDGFSILYYQDVDSLIYWANEAAYRWKIRGMCMWSLGQEDLRLWEWLPKQI
jgi:hypothetical protein